MATAEGTPRSRALAIGGKTYSTGRPCKRGHIGPRYVATRHCVACSALHAKERNTRYPEKRRVLDRRYGFRHREQRTKYSRAWYARHQEIVRAKTAAWRKANPVARVAICLRYFARKRNAPGAGVTAAQWRTILAGSLGLCVYCNGRSAKLTMEHVEPLANGGAHDVDNTAAACESCNYSKQNKSLLAWLAVRAQARETPAILEQGARYLRRKQA